MRPAGVMTAEVIPNLALRVRQDSCREKWPLMWAIVSDDMMALRTLLPRRSNPNQVCGPQGVTPLHVAVRWGRVDIAEMLARMGARVFERDDTGRTPVDDAEQVPAWHVGGARADPGLGAVVPADDIREVREILTSYESPSDFASESSEGVLRMM